jgi:type I restriction enzyme S subunit
LTVPVSSDRPTWQVLRLDQVCAKPIVYGIVQAGLNTPGGVPYIRSTDVGRPLDAARLLRTTPEIAARYRRSTVAAGDIVFSLRGDIGSLSIVPPNLEGANLTQGTARISPSEATSGLFLFYALQAGAVQRALHSIAKGSALQEVTLKDLRGISVSFPRSKAEQHHLATLLSMWDQSAHLLAAQIDRVKQYHRGIAQKLLAGKVRFPGFTGQWGVAPFLSVPPAAA